MFSNYSFSKSNFFIFFLTFFLNIFFFKVSKIMCKTIFNFFKYLFIYLLEF